VQDVDPASAQAISATRDWLLRAVIGLNLCPFAKGVHVKGQIRYIASTAVTEDALLDDLVRELQTLEAAAPDDIDTTLLITPHVLADFSAFADFLDLVEVVLGTHGYRGRIQVASFHPDYVFADTEADDMANYTNRAPFPILHLLREASLSKAVAAFPDAALIYERNIATLRRIGLEGWRALGVSRPAVVGDAGS